MATIGDVDAIVKTDINTAQAVATKAVDNAQALLATVKDIVGNALPPYLILNEIPPLDLSDINADPTDKAKRPPDSVLQPAMPSKPPELNQDDYVVPPIDNLVKPNDPMQLDVKPIDPLKVEGDQTIRFPKEPTIDLDLIMKQMPTLPPFDPPTFDGEKPSNNLLNGLPVNTFSYGEVEYISDLKDAVKAKILTMVKNGWQSTAPEDAIWRRFYERLAIATNDAIDAKMTAWASRGWTLPTGMANRQIGTIIIEQMNGLLDSSREIMIKQADLTDRNDSEYTAKALAFEGMMIQHADNVANRALLVQRTVVELAVMIFNSRVAAYNAQLAAYESAVRVYESKMRAEIAKCDFFKAQIDGLRLEADVQKTAVQIYEAELSAVMSRIKAYETIIEATKAEIEYNKANIDLYRAKLDANKVDVDVNIARANTKIASLKTKLDAYVSMVQTYTADVNAEISRVGAVTRIYEADQGLYREAIQLSEAQARLRLGQSEIELKQADINRRNLLTNTELNLRAFLELTRMQITGGVEAGHVYASMANAAMSALSTVVQLQSQATTNYQG